LKKEDGAMSGNEEGGVDCGGVSNADGDDAREEVDADDGEAELVAPDDDEKSSVWNMSDKSVKGEGEKYWLWWRALSTSILL
jgi:hypothetical protein